MKNMKIKLNTYNIFESQTCITDSAPPGTAPSLGKRSLIFHKDEKSKKFNIYNDDKSKNLIFDIDEKGKKG